MWEALAIIAGGSVSAIGMGMMAVSRLRADYIRHYLARLGYVGIDKPASALHPDLAAALQPAGFPK